MIEEQYIFICLEVNAETIRATRDQWCRHQSKDIVINSVLSEFGIFNVNAVLEDPEFFSDQGRVRDELLSYINSLKKTQPTLAELLTANAPSLFENNLQELHKWSYTLKKIINTSGLMTKIMFPRAHSENHLFLNEAEGETSATWIRSALYRRTDFLPKLLKECVSNLGIDCGEYGPSETILSSWQYHARRIVRTFGMTIARALMHSKNAVRHHRKILPAPLAAQIQLLVIVRSVIHAEYFSALLKDPRTICLVQDGLGAYPKVLLRAKIEGASQIIHCYDLVTTLQILKLTFQTLRELCSFTFQAYQDSRPYIFTLDGMPINMTTVIKECMVGSLDTSLLVKAIAIVASRADFEIKGVAHSELITAYPFAIKAGCEIFQIPTLQFAFATYEYRPQPNFIFADRFFCFSVDQRDSILELVNPPDPAIVCYAGNLLIDSSKDDFKGKPKDRNSALRDTILFYSQPFDDEIDESIIIVKRITDAMNLTLKVVMHPRERAVKFIKYGADLCILTNEVYIEKRSELFKKTLFAITRNSNVGYQLLLRDIPLINYLSAVKDALVKHEYYKGYPLLVYSEEELAQVMESSKEYIEKYRIFRKSYIERSYLHKGADDVIATIFEVIYVT